MPRYHSDQLANNGLRPLSPRENNFVGEYLIDLHGTKAAIRAGYSPRTAAVQASDLLKRPNVIAAIQERRDRHARHLDISAERVLDEMAACAFSSMQDFWPTPGERLDLSKIDRRLTAAVSTLKIKETLVVGHDGEPAMIERLTEIKLYSKLSALEKLGDHLGLFEAPDRDSLEERVKRMTPDERVTRMEQILEMARQRYAHLIEKGSDAVDSEN